MTVQLLPLLFVLSGTLNVVTIKWADSLESEGNDGSRYRFQHPMVQTAVMFLGELLCFAIYKIAYFILERRQDGSEIDNFITRGSREFSPMTFLLPALCDTIASVMLFSGLYLTYASSFQMIRGVAIIFVGIFSAIFLNQSLILRHWLAMFIIFCSTGIICLMDAHRTSFLPGTDGKSVITGDLLIISAQVFHALQFVHEEKHIKALDIPAMQAVGWQGLFGFGITCLMMIPLNFLQISAPFDQSSRTVFDDLSDVIPQFLNNRWIIVAHGIFLLSVALYNFTALSIMKFSSSTNRIIADSVRVPLIWLAAVFYDWEFLNFIYLFAFLLYLIGAIAYRNAVFMEFYRRLLGRLQRRNYADLRDDNQEASSRPADTM